MTTDTSAFNCLLAVVCMRMHHDSTGTHIHCCSLIDIILQQLQWLTDWFAWVQQVPAVPHMAQLRTPADLESDPNRSDFEANSMQILGALRSSTSDPSLRMHRVQSWLASNSPNTGCMGGSSEDPVTSGVDPTMGERDGRGVCGVASKEYACAAPALQTVESAAAVTPVVADSSRQPTPVDEASSNQSTLVQQQTEAESPKQRYSEEAATQQAFAAVATEKRQSAVHALVQRFEHMTVARLASSKPAGAALGLLVPAPSDQAPQQGLSEDMMRLTLKREVDVSANDDEIHSNSSEGFSPRRELQSSRTAVASAWDDYPSTSQPPEWHVNTVYQSESSSGEQAGPDPASTRNAELAASGAAGVGCAEAPCWPEWLAGVADVEILAIQGSGEATPRYADMGCAPAGTAPCTPLPSL